MRPARAIRTAEQNALLRSLDGYRSSDGVALVDPLARHFLGVRLPPVVSSGSGVAWCVDRLWSGVHTRSLPAPRSSTRPSLRELARGRCAGRRVVLVPAALKPRWSVAARPSRPRPINHRRARHSTMPSRNDPDASNRGRRRDPAGGSPARSNVALGLRIEAWQTWAPNDPRERKQAVVVNRNASTCDKAAAHRQVLRSWATMHPDGCYRTSPTPTWSTGPAAATARTTTDWCRSRLGATRPTPFRYHRSFPTR
jgi:hypothetical protein